MGGREAKHHLSDSAHKITQNPENSMIYRNDGESMGKKSGERRCRWTGELGGGEPSRNDQFLSLGARNQAVPQHHSQNVNNVQMTQ
jgi:hypothetical protein